MRAVVLAIAIVGAAVSVAPAAGQEEVRLRGTVIDDGTSEPLEGASVLVLDTLGRELVRRVSDGRGEFEAHVAVGVRAVVLRVERIGYAEARSSTLTFGDHVRFDVEIRLATDAMVLEPLTVVVRAPRDGSSRMPDAVRRRMEVGSGVYLTRADIERRDPARVTDLLTTVAGVRVSPRRSGARSSVAMGRRIGPGRCPAQIWVDGMLINDPQTGLTMDETVDGVVSPGAIEVIEIYRGLATVPPRFTNEFARCGVVVIWTRRG
ncbi:MAG: carboxypeptidase regulatory-like domain-containing protein [Gemmatimonadota bacterium]